MQPFDSANEKWLPVPGCPGYEVSSFGRVRSIERVVFRRSRWHDCYRKIPGKILRPRPSGSGHVSVCLRVNGESVNRWIHRLVLEAFVGPCPEGMECCHFPDRNPANNTIGNLRWGTKSENTLDSVVHGTSRLGSTVSDEVRAVLRKKATGRKHTAEARRKMSESHRGTRRSAETKARMSLAQLARYKKERECSRIS